MGMNMDIDLQATYLGLTLRSPFIASASPLTGHLDRISELADAGAGAIVLPSLFEEQIERETAGIERVIEAEIDTDISGRTEGSGADELDDYNLGADSYMALVRAAKARVSVPIIASLNGVNVGDWLRYTRLLEDAGADAVELNLYSVAADTSVSGADLEAEQLEMITVLTEDLTIPLAVKISPYYSALGSFATSVAAAGARGLVMFNRFYQPDLDPATLEMRSTINLSTSADALMTLRWVGILSPQLPISIAATSGIHSGVDAAKMLLAGADTVMVASALLRNGPHHLVTMHDELRSFMAEHGYTSLEQMRGLAHRVAVADADAYQRANYIGVLATAWQHDL